MNARSCTLALGALLLAACASGRVFAFDPTTPVVNGDGKVVTLVDLLATGRHEDFARLQCTSTIARPLPGRGSPRAGSLAVAYGYPDGCGVDSRGRVVVGHAFAGRPLAPLRLLLRVVQAEPLLLEPIAGAVPLGGFSGGGIFDLDGRVIGVLVGSEWDPSLDAVRVRVAGVSVDAMR